MCVSAIACKAALLVLLGNSFPVSFNKEVYCDKQSCDVNVYHRKTSQLMMWRTWYTDDISIELNNGCQSCIQSKKEYEVNFN